MKRWILAVLMTAFASAMTSVCVEAGVRLALTGTLINLVPSVGFALLSTCWLHIMCLYIEHTEKGVSA